MDPNFSFVQPVELGGQPSPGLLLKNVYALYGSQFRRWFGITAPTSLLASVVLLMADHRIRAIYRSIPRGEIQFHWGKIAETSVLRSGSFFISWLLGCFAVAAIATVVNRLDVDVEFALIRAVGWAHFSRFNFVAVLIGYVLVASIVSWFGMAIPLILSGAIGVWAAVKKSVRLSNGYEVFLFLLVVESVVGSYVAWYAAHYGLTFLFPTQLRSTAWYGWVVYFVAVLASAAVQPPMFIGFSLLAANEHANPLFLPRTQQAAQIH